MSDVDRKEQNLPANSSKDNVVHINRDNASGETNNVEPIETPRRSFDELPAPAQRALLEAQARRQEAEKNHKPLPKEYNGRGGLEPTRYDDWEVKGITSDF